MGIKILATADLHLGRTSSESDALVEKGATRATWERLVQLAIDEKVQALVLAGDVVEHDNRYFEAASALEEGLSKLESAKIHVFMVAGNHDYDVLPEIMKNREYQYVHLLGKNGNWEFRTVSLQNTTIQFAGWSFPNKYEYSDPVLDFPEEKLDANIPTIGLIHGDFGAVESPYAPLDLSSMSRHRVTAWVMGHIHKAEVFHENDPLIFYPGSPHALSPKEKGIHGAVLLTINEHGLQERKNVDLSPVRYEHVEVDISNSQEKDTVRSTVFSSIEEFAKLKVTESNASHLLVCDVILTGAHEKVADINNWIAGWDFREGARNIKGLTYSIRTIYNQCTVKVGDLSSLATEPSPAGMLAKAIIDLQDNKPSDFLNSLRKNLKKEIHNLNFTTTYNPLRDSESVKLWDSDSEEDLNYLLEQECHRLLSALLSNKMEA